jgi:hypothetical protein
MKKINKLTAIGLVAIAGFSTVSCDLDLLPMNEVVLENYWKEEADVNSVVNSCYVGMQEGGFINKVITWGELRAENVTQGPDVPGDIQQLLKCNLLSTNGCCNWDAFYNVINRCNIVLHYAPSVADVDPNYNTTDLNMTTAEVKAIRALSYFYLIRTFKDVPFTLNPSIDDFQEYVVPATKHEIILDSLILDLEGCKDYAPLKNPDRKKNTGRVTRNMIYTLLADMYLWKASDYNLPVAAQQEAYRKCIEYCDMVINYKINQYKIDEDGDLDKAMDKQVFAEYGYPLLAELREGSTTPHAYNAIFGTGNSFESIFELTYGNAESDIKNTDLTYMYGGSTQNGGETTYVLGNENLIATEITSAAYNDETLFPVTYDYRSLTSFHFNDGTAPEINKYIVRNYTGSESDFGKVGSAWKAATAARPNISWISTQQGVNWIVYRLTDVMLMRAEAEINLAATLTPVVEEPEEGTEPAKTRANGASLSTADELYQDAFNLISAVYLRSNPEAPSGARPAFANYTTYESMMKLLDNERRREFLFEGKRYYDLVRRSRRDGNTEYYAASLASKFGEASKAVLIKMAMLDFIYMPYAERQIDVNPLLNQNPAYAKEDEIVKN